jgi:hypothetical protein
MNLEKARDQYSEYREGTLDAGLRQQFERSLAEDANLRADYESYVRAMELLEATQGDEIPEPAFLHDRIMSAVERSQAKAPQAAPFWARWRLAVFGGIATLAIVGTVLSLNRPAGDGMAVADPTGLSQSRGSSASFAVNEGQLALEVRHERPVEVVAFNSESGDEIRRFAPVASLSTPLRNDNRQPVVVRVEIRAEGTTPLLVALPGTEAGGESSGTGSVLSYAKRVAQATRTPVEIRVRDTSQTLSWDLGETPSIESAMKALNGTRYAMTLREDGLLVLSESR